MTHPTTDMLAAFLDGRLSPVERDEVAGHLNACDECRHELSVAASALAAHAGERRRPRWLLPAAAAATIATLLLVPLGRMDDAGETTPLQRGDRPEGVQIFAGVAPEDGVGVSRGELSQFQWRSVASGATYAVVLTNSMGDEVWTVSTTDTVASLPEAVQLDPGLYFWWVDALLGGTETAMMETRELTITR